MSPTMHQQVVLWALGKIDYFRNPIKYTVVDTTCLSCMLRLCLVHHIVVSCF